jgi:hypothetical protein
MRNLDFGRVADHSDETNTLDGLPTIRPLATVNTTPLAMIFRPTGLGLAFQRYILIACDNRAAVFARRE